MYERRNVAYQYNSDAFPTLRFKKRYNYKQVFHMSTEPLEDTESSNQSSDQSSGALLGRCDSQVIALPEDVHMPTVTLARQQK
jgi:hypothetical protein